MSTFFKDLSSDGLEKAEDRLGGGSFVRETGVDDFIVKHAYAASYDSGAQYIDLALADSTGKLYQQRILITNGKGENFYTDKQSGKKMPLMGFSLVDALCMLTTEKPLAAQDVVERTVKAWSKEAGRETNQQVPMLVDVVGQPITAAIVKQLVWKQVKNTADGKYYDSDEEAEQNEIVKFFHTETKLSLTEAENGKTEGEFYHAWVEANVIDGVGKPQNKRSKKNPMPGGGVAGRPPVTGGAAPAAGAAPKKSLFGKS